MTNLNLDFLLVYLLLKFIKLSKDFLEGTCLEESFSSKLLMNLYIYLMWLKF